MLNISAKSEQLSVLIVQGLLNVLRIDPLKVVASVGIFHTGFISYCRCHFRLQIYNLAL